MTRPKLPRRIRFTPNVVYFKPQGVPLRLLDEVVLDADEVESLRLHDKQNLNHIDSANKMNVSQPTFTRTLNSAYKKIADALIHGKAIRIQKA